MSKTNTWLVYHKTGRTTLFQLKPSLWKERDKDYQLVALVEADSLEEVYALTNHIDRDRRENALVKSMATQPPRSTSVGDVIVQGDKAWLVERTGFRRLTW
jgi:hypothetical protein